MKTTLPSCVYLKHGSYWYVKGGKWTNLGSELATALAEYGRILEAPAGGMAALVDEALACARKEPSRRTGRKLSKNTLRQYEEAGEKIKAVFRDYAPEQVKTKHIKRLMRALADTPNMANRILTVARLVFNHAIDEDRVDANPCYGVEPYIESKRERLITLDEWCEIYWCAGPRMQLIMRLEYLTGQRIGDVLAIQMSQINDEGIEFDQGKTGAKLTVRWSQDLRDAVNAAKELLDRPSLTLFRSRPTKGRDPKAPDYRSVHEQWARACELAGVKDARPNDQRAQSATATKKQGKSATALLGHTSEKMTERYLRDRERPFVDGPGFSVH